MHALDILHLTSILPVYVSDAEDGNVYVSIDANEGFFACGSISSSLYSFDPNTNSFEELQGLPRPRYRHSSSIVGNQVWLVGGRTIEDSLIPEIDVSGIFYHDLIIIKLLTGFLVLRSMTSGPIPGQRLYCLSNTKFPTTLALHKIHSTYTLLVDTIRTILLWTF